MTDEFDELKQNIGVRGTWVRLFYMLLFGVIFWVCELLIGLVAVFQFLHVLFTTRTNEAVLRFGRGLAVFVSDIVRFLSYNTEDMPFPFADWPQDGGKGSSASRRGGKSRKTGTKAAPTGDSEDASDSADSAGA